MSEGPVGDTYYQPIEKDRKEHVRSGGGEGCGGGEVVDCDRAALAV